MWSFAIVLAAYAARSAFALNDGASSTPAMGWNTYNAFGYNINEKTILDNARALKSSGLAAAGYQYVVVDDAWSTKSRDGSGKLVADAGKFPKGMKALAADIHALGLKAGIYGDAGSATCGGYPGSGGHEATDAATFVEWGFDYVKYDNCNVGDNSESATKARYKTMGDALSKAGGGKVVFSLCNWGQHAPWTWGGQVGHSARISGDIGSAFTGGGGCVTVAQCAPNSNAPFGGVNIPVMNIIEKAVDTGQYAGKGFWPDMDMLEVGHGGYTAGEQRVNFVMWSILKSPLILGNNLAAMSPDTVALIGNKEIIAANQDALGTAAKRVAKTACTGSLADPASYGSPEASANLQATSVWVGPLSGGKYVVAFLNGCPGAQRIRLLETHLPKGSYTVRDIIKGKDVGTASAGAGLASNSAGSATASIGTGGASLLVSDVPGHDVAAFVLSPGSGSGGHGAGDAAGGTDATTTKRPDSATDSDPLPSATPSAAVSTIKPTSKFAEGGGSAENSLPTATPSAIPKTKCRRRRTMT